MKIVLISSVDKGGGGLAASRLHRGLVDAGMDSHFFCRSASATLPNAKVFEPVPGKLSALSKRYLRYRKRHLESGLLPGMSQLWGADHLSRFGGTAATQIPQADVWNLHSVFDLFEYRAFFQAAARDTFIAWTLHHMSPLTGGCSYAQACRRYEESCGKCQYLRPEGGEQDGSHQVWKAKMETYSKVPKQQLAIVAPSRWMAESAAKSSLFAGRAVHVIPYGYDLELFRPHDRAFCRKILGIPESARVVLFVSQFDRTIIVKGFVHLEKAIARLSHNSNLICMSVGPAKGMPEICGVPLVETGMVEQQWMLPLVYSAADMLVVPSLEDNFPNVVLEASACGLPVVGAISGGIPEMIGHDVTGLLVPKADPEAIANAVQTLLDHPETRQRMSQAGREKCEREFAMSTQVRRYEELYRAGLDELRHVPSGSRV